MRVTSRARGFRASLLWGAALVVTLPLAGPIISTPPAYALGSTVSAVPAAWTPRLQSANSTVRQLVPSGATMYAVGTFTQISNSAGTVFSRQNVFAFNATTGAVSSWAPQVNGTVYSAAASADGTSVYLGGAFSSVHGTAVSNLAKVSAATGAVDTTFKARANAAVRALWLTGSHLIVGGNFTSIGGVAKVALASISPTTGSDDGYLKVVVSGISPYDSVTRVIKFAPSHAGTRLLVMGGFRTVAGQPRQQIFMLDLGTTVTLDPWSSPQFMLLCSTGIPLWLQASAWSPDDSQVAIATTGYKGASMLCDAAALFPSSGSNLGPTWINKTGCDSLYTVAVTTSTVYIGGHERWADNPLGCDKAGPGAVSRPGVGALGRTSGLATSWNPTRSRGHAADDMELTSQGLWVASDNEFSANYCAYRYHPGICMFPWAT